MTHPTEMKNASQCDDKCEIEAICNQYENEPSFVASNNVISTKTEQKNNEIIDLLVAVAIFMLLGQLASIILDKLSLISYLGVRDTVQAVLFMCAVGYLNLKYPLDMSPFDKPLLLRFSLIGIGLCFVIFIPFFISLIKNPRITEKYAIYLNLSGIHFFWSLILLIVIGPITEELLFRGFLFKLIINRTNMIIAAIISSIIFEAIHGIQTGWLLNHFLLGIICCYVYAKSNSIWASAITHMGNNAIWYFCTGFLSNKF